jgi:tRNA nucleotidyltransferase (CCA-adding enzyme)
MAYNPKVGLIDYFNGVEDLSKKIIRTVGDEDTRFKEDALRILRCLRFSAIYGFDIDVNTKKAVLNNKELLNNISKERVSNELIKLICGKNAENVLREYKDVFSVIIPELKPMFEFDQNTKHHDKTLWEHTLCALGNIDSEPILRMTILLHDIGKPSAEFKDKQGVSHYKNHDKIGKSLAEKILTNLKFSKDFINRVTLLISIHDTYVDENKVAIKKFLNYLGKENFAYYLKIQFADKMAQSNYKRNEKIGRIKSIENIFNEVIKNNECYSLKQLAVNGDDLISAGLKSGLEVGVTLDKLLNLVIEEKCPNIKSELLKHI